MFVYGLPIQRDGSCVGDVWGLDKCAEEILWMAIKSTMSMNE